MCKEIHAIEFYYIAFDLLRVACPSLTYLIGKLSRLATRSAVPLKAALTTDWTHTKGEMARRGVRPGTRSAGLMHRTMSHCSHIESRCLSRPNRTSQLSRQGVAQPAAVTDSSDIGAFCTPRRSVSAYIHGSSVNSRG